MKRKMYIRNTEIADIQFLVLLSEQPARRASAVLLAIQARYNDAMCPFAAKNEYWLFPHLSTTVWG